MRHKQPLRPAYHLCTRRIFNKFTTKKWWKMLFFIPRRTILFLEKLIPLLISLTAPQRPQNRSFGRSLVPGPVWKFRIVCAIPARLSKEKNRTKACDVYTLWRRAGYLFLGSFVDKSSLFLIHLLYLRRIINGNILCTEHFVATDDLRVEK